MNRSVTLTVLLAASCLFASPLAADVKTGVDAWSRGDYAAAIREWEPLAAKGEADAQFNLAQAYKWGRGVRQDIRKAETLYGKAAGQGHMRASDEYGLLLFDRGERSQALPYVKAASDRGDARAQYLLAIAHFNGDMVGKDWVRAYALMSLARSAGLPQAVQGLQQMDSYIPLAQRQQAVSLSQQIATDTEATRNRQLASADLGATAGAPPSRPAPAPAPLERVPPAPPVQPLPRPESAVAMAERNASGAVPRTAGADYARPTAPIPAAPAPAAPVAISTKPAQSPAIAAAKPTPMPAPAPIPAAGGTWRIQFGAFGVAANADALWAKVKARPEVTGHPRINVPLGSVTKLQAGGYSEDGARAACSKLSAAGLTCAPVRN